VDTTIPEPARTGSEACATKAAGAATSEKATVRSAAMCHARLVRIETSKNKSKTSAKTARSDEPARRASRPAFGLPDTAPRVTSLAL
jgi:hypothetical protein